MKKLWLILMVAVMALAVAGCSPQVEEPVNESSAVQVEAEKSATEETTEEATDEAMEETSKEAATKTVYPLTLKDHADREITIDKKPEAIVTLAPSLTETVFALGAQDTLKGRTNYCTYPAEVSEIDSVGTLKDPNIEVIAEIAPDVIFASTHFQEETMNKLDELGFTVVILSSQDSFEGVYDVIEKAGLILDKQVEAGELVAEMTEKVNHVIEAVDTLEPTNVYYVVGYGEYGDYTAGNGTFISEMITMAGGENAANDTDGWTYSLEKLVEKDPYMLVCSKYHNTKTGIEAANGYMDLTAVQEGRLFEIDNNLLDRQGPRLADGLVELAKILHPEAFN